MATSTSNVKAYAQEFDLLIFTGVQYAAPELLWRAKLLTHWVWRIRFRDSNPQDELRLRVQLLKSQHLFATIDHKLSNTSCFGKQNVLFSLTRISKYDILSLTTTLQHQFDFIYRRTIKLLSKRHHFPNYNRLAIGFNRVMHFHIW